MLFDLQDFACPLQFEVDICVVGAGPAGITIARNLSESGLKVCLAESGGLTEESETQSLYSGSSIGHPIVLTEGRYRVFGGSTTRWGGKSVPLDPIDFEKRSWVKYSGWPINYNSLQLYYDKAKRFSNFQSEFWDDIQGLASINRKIPEFDTTDVRPYVWRFASRDLSRTWKTYFSLGYKPSFDWARSYGPDLVRGRNTFVVLHANLISMRGSQDAGSIKDADFRSLNGNVLRVRSKMFVLACSGIENARIALNLPAPLLERMDQFDNLGRYFSQHPSGEILSLNTSNFQASQLQKKFNIFSRPPRFPVQYQLGFALSEAAQRKYEILNASAMLKYTASEKSAWASARRLRESARKRNLSKSDFYDLMRVMSNSGNTISGAFKKYVSGFEHIIPNPRISVIINLEQEPNRESRIRLSHKRDSLGMRQAEIDWRISEIERKTSKIFGESLARIFERLDLGKAELAGWLSETGTIKEESLQGNYHFIGATRMAKMPADGVVDENCCTFGISNLFFAGASVFPTGGHANPTLTIIALAIRLADHLRDEMAKRH